MEILGFFVLMLIGSIIGSALDWCRQARANPQVEADPFVDARYSRIATELNIDSAQVV